MSGNTVGLIRLYIVIQYIVLLFLILGDGLTDLVCHMKSERRLVTLEASQGESYPYVGAGSTIPAPEDFCTVSYHSEL